MTMISEAKRFMTDWIDAVSGAVEALMGRFVRAQRIRLVEADDGTFTASAATKDRRALSGLCLRLEGGRPQPPLPAEWKTALRGSQIEVQLRSAHVLTHQLDFPAKAADFLDGMIRAQVDRLTPWTVNEAIFGWSPPAPAANDRIPVTFAATSRQKIDPVRQFAAVADAASIVIVAPATADAPAPIRLLDQPLRSVIGSAINMPRLLRAILLSAGVAAAASLAINAYLGGSLQSDLDELQQRISQQRAALRVGEGATSRLGLLAKRKQTMPSSVMVIEALSRALPDSTYVTELRIEGDKVQVVGMTQDAASLIRLMEQSPQFTRATFFAPTTHAANETGERFHIEAHITAYFGSGS